MASRLLPSKAGPSLPSPLSAGGSGAQATSARPSFAYLDSKQDVTQIRTASLDESWEDISRPDGATARLLELQNTSTSPSSAATLAIPKETALSAVVEKTSTQAQLSSGRYRNVATVSLAPPSLEEIRQASAVVESWISPEGSSSEDSSAAGSTASSLCDASETMEFADRAMQLAESVTGSQIRNPLGENQSPGSGLSRDLSVSGSGASELFLYNPGFKDKAAQMLKENPEEISNLVRDLWPALMRNENTRAILERHASSPPEGPKKLQEVEQEQVEVEEDQTEQPVAEQHQTGHAQAKGHSCSGKCSCSCSTTHGRATEAQDEQVMDPQRVEKKQESANRSSRPPTKLNDGNEGWKGHQGGASRGTDHGPQGGGGTGFEEAPRGGFWDWAPVLMAVVVLVASVILFGRFRYANR